MRQLSQPGTIRFDQGADAGQRAPSMLAFVLLASAFGLGGIAFSLPVLMLPVLDGLGLGASAILAGALFGPAQTAGRFAELLFGRRMHALGVAMLAMIAVVLSLVILGVGGTTVTGAIAFAILFGAGVGVGYVTRGSVVLALYGTRDYATWLGRLGATGSWYRLPRPTSLRWYSSRPARQASSRCVR